MGAFKINLLNSLLAPILSFPFMPFRVRGGKGRTNSVCPEI